MTPAPGAECQHRGGSGEGRGDAAPLLPSHSTRREGGRGGPAANTHTGLGLVVGKGEAPPSRLLAGCGHIPGSCWVCGGDAPIPNTRGTSTWPGFVRGRVMEPSGRPPRCSSSVFGASGARGWLMCPGMCAGAVPGRSRVRAEPQERGGTRGLPGPRVGEAGRRGKVRLGQMQPLHPPPVLCTLMQMHWPEWFISSMWNGIMHPHPISLMKKREPAPGTKLPTLGECSGSAMLGRGAPPFLPLPSLPLPSLPFPSLRRPARPGHLLHPPPSILAPTTAEGGHGCPHLGVLPARQPARGHRGDPRPGGAGPGGVAALGPSGAEALAGCRCRAERCPRVSLGLGAQSLKD